MTEPRICTRPGCCTPLVRRPTERADHWKARDYCSNACKHALIRAKYNTGDRPGAERKVCAECGETMIKAYDESRKRWENRTACSRACARALQKQGKRDAIKLAMPRAAGIVAPPTKSLSRCTCCGRDIPKPDGMTWAKYRAKTTCGAEACKTAQTRRPMTGGPSEIVAAVTTLTLPSPKQRLAWQQASDAERRLFAPEIRAAMGAM